MSFEDLLGKLNEVATLAKALPADAGGAADDKKIQAAAADGADGDDEGTDAEGVEGKDADAASGDGDEGDEDDGKPLTKSFMLSLEDGTQMEAFDGTAMIKSLTDRLEVSEAALKTNEEQVLKSLNVAVDLISAQSVQLNEQGVLIKSLQGKVSELAKSGRGRASTLTVAEKPNLETSLAKSQPAGMGREEVLAKSLSAMKSGRITGLEAAGIENRLNMGIAIEPELISRISSN